MERPRSRGCTRGAPMAAAEPHLARRKWLAAAFDFVQPVVPAAPSCGLASGKSRFQLVERARPAFFMGPARLVVMQTGMGERDLGALGNGPQRDLDARLVRVFRAAFPAPT